MRRAGEGSDCLAYHGIAESHVSVAEFQAFIAKHPDRWEHRALRKDAVSLRFRMNKAKIYGLDFE